MHSRPGEGRAGEGMLVVCLGMVRMFLCYCVCCISVHAVRRKWASEGNERAPVASRRASMSLVGGGVGGGRGVGGGVTTFTMVGGVRGRVGVVGDATGGDGMECGSPTCHTIKIASD